MRIVPFITAILVVVFLYFLVVEREALFEFAGMSDDDTNESSVDDSESTIETVPSASVTTSDAVAVIVRNSIAQTVDSAVRVRGETQAARQVELRAETSGQVVSTPLRKGSFVTTGQLMCEIDKGTREVSLAEAEARLADARSKIPETEARIPESVARLQEATSRLEEAEINKNAAEKLFEGGFASETRVASAVAAVRSAEAGISSAQAGLKSAKAGLDSIQASIQSAEAGVAAAQNEIAKLSIRAPFDGLLESDTAELGSLMQPGSLCATIIQLDPIKVVGFVPEADVNKISVGVDASGALIDGTSISGKVTFVSRSADQLTRTFLVEIEVPNSDLKIRDGQTVDIEIESDGVLAHLLPQSVQTLNNAGDVGVRLVIDGLSTFVPISIIRDTPEGIWVDGLPDNADVILIGQEYTTDGTKVVPYSQELFQ